MKGKAALPPLRRGGLGGQLREFRIEHRLEHLYLHVEDWAWSLRAEESVYHWCRQIAAFEEMEVAFRGYDTAAGYRLR
ncbi:hypothetical protein [Candidatus Laterigemmans baculatus]|uniref:hypothetical protein n=1 Tax=Candidatus Laterigemmans baculatus TaxID=2770505 RepID=UPI0013DAAD53|nr:hypothetical protein [Candidatus Laterigemmans baculatus]